MQLPFDLRPGMQLPLLQRPVRIAITYGLLAIAPGIASAAGLGELTLHSRLGQNLDAEIGITSADAEDLKTLTAYMASNDVFDQMDIIQASILQHIRFSVEPNTAKGPVLKITSNKPVREPFVTFVVELSWADGTYLREYTFLLDPVLTQRPGNALSSEPVTGIVEETEQAVLEAIEPEQTSNHIIVVQRGDNLLDIARSVKPDRLSIEQVAIAIYNKNPSAFYGSVHKLNRGAELIIPHAGEMSGMSTQAARRAFAAKPSAARKVAKNTIKKNTKTASRTVNNAQVEPSRLAPKVLVKQSDLDANSTDQQAAVVVSESMGGKRRYDNTASVSALRELILELRGAMVGLGQELTVKTTQLDEITKRVDHLQEQQAITYSTTDTKNAAIVPPAAAVQKVPESSIAPAALATAPDGDPEKIADVVDNSAIPGEATPSSSKARVPASPTDAIGPISMLEQNQYSPTGASKATDVQKDLPTSTSTLTADAPRSGSATESIQSETETKEKAGAFAWFFDTQQNKQFGNRLRDAGLLSLALILGFVLLRKLFRSAVPNNLATDSVTINPDESNSELNKSTTDSGNFDVLSPLSAIEYFRTQLTSEQRKEHMLKDDLKDHPTRQDIRLELLRLYHSRGATEMFTLAAREMYEMTSGKNIEWHSVIEMGLELDPTMAFYSEPDDHEFTLSDEFAVSGARISSVSGGKSVGSQPSEKGSGGDVRVSDMDVGESDNDTADLDDFHQASLDTNSLEIDALEPDTNEPTNTTSSNLDYAALDKNNNEASIDIELDDNTFLDEAVLDAVTQHHPNSLVMTDDDFNIEEKAPSDTDQDSTFDQIANLDINDTSQSNNPSEDDSEIDRQPISIWKDCEVRLDLAAVYMEMGNVSGTHDLLMEVLKNGDAAQVSLAQSLLKKLGNA